MATKKRELVVKANQLVEARYRLHLVEHQLIVYAISRAREEERGLTAGSWLTIDAAKFAEQFGTDKKNAYRQIQDAANNLWNRAITLYGIDIDTETGEKQIIETRWIAAKARIDNAERVQLMFSPLVIPYITRLQKDVGNFTRYYLENISSMTSVHAVRMYELLVQYRVAGTREFELARLREILCLGDEYPRILDFKKWVIDVAMKQINEHSDLIVSYKQRKTGRTVTHLDFEIKTKQDTKKAAAKPKTAKQKPVAAGGSDARARPGESQYDFERRMLEQAGQQRI
jgi:plasmid replication initiation protein